jgi:glycosyltransferase involved in cell wall biosynthesis
METNLKVLYISTNFTALSHTFITREINGLRDIGVDVKLLSVRNPDTSAATKPECDLSGCKFVYPASFFPVLGGVISTFFRSPSRFITAAKTAFVNNEDSFKQKLKLFYQMLIACRFAGWIINEDVQHIHSHFAGSPTSFSMFLSALTGCPFTFTDHGAGVFHDRIGLKTKFRRASGVSSISEFNTQFYPQVADTVPTTKIVRCGLRMSDFTFNHRQKCNTPLHILAVSRIVPKKGFTYLFDGLAYLDEEGIDWNCTMVGEGPLIPELQEKAKSLGFADKVTFTGPLQQGEIRKLMLVSDMFVLPCVLAPDGDMDGIPVTLMEAMACGCPVISTELSGVPELVINDKTGLLLKPEDGLAVGKAMAQLAVDSELTAKISKGGYDWVNDEFNIKKSARRISEFFAEIASKRKN